MLPRILAILAAATLASSMHPPSCPKGAACPATGKKLTPRPQVKPWPHNTGRAQLVSPPRDRLCHVEPARDGGDDAPAILEAFHECNFGGVVVLDGDYTISSPLDLRFLKTVDVALSGRVSFSDDIDYWTASAFRLGYQNSSAFWLWGGSDVHIYGGGTLDGRGQRWWDVFGANPSLARPILFVTDGMDGGTFGGINMINSPNWYNLIANTTDFIINDVNISGRSTSKHEAKNTDGWDTYRSDGVVIQNSIINNGDDCVSFKPNSTNLVVQGLQCNGSHGISVGSLGQYPLEYDIVENITVYNTTMSHASDGARIKVWPGTYTGFQDLLLGGGGAGHVRNVTYEKYHNIDNDWAIEVNQCYGQRNKTLCQMFPFKVVISDIHFLDFTGTTSKKHDPKVGTLVCSSPKQCYNIDARKVTIKPPSGKPPKWVCSGFDTSGLEGFDCVSP